MEKSERKMLNNQTINVDFDGTCCTHEYPEIGKDIGAIPVLKELVAAGHKIILFTMRSGKEEAEAAAWLREQGVELYAIGRNPTQYRWTKSRKCYAHWMIDDSAIGCPLVTPPNGKRPYVDWVRVRQELAQKGLLPMLYTGFCSICGREAEFKDPLELGGSEWVMHHDAAEGSFYGTCSDSCRENYPDFSL